MDFLQKPVTYSKSLVHLSKVSIYVNEHISAIRIKSPCVIVHKQDSQNAYSWSHITVHSVSITWGKLYRNSLDDSKCIEMQNAALLMYAIYPIQKYKFTHYCMWGIDWKRLDRIDSTTSLWYRKEKEIWAQRWKYKIRKGKNRKPTSDIVSHDWQHGPQ